MGINDLLVEINYLAERVKEVTSILGLVNEYILKVEKNIKEHANIDLFSEEDALNREFSIDLFVVNLEDKVQFLLAQPKMIDLTSRLTEDIGKLKVA